MTSNDKNVLKIIPHVAPSPLVPEEGEKNESWCWCPQ